jgi:hypothetical protein
MINGVGNINIDLYPFRDLPRRNRVSFYGDAVDDRGIPVGRITTLEVEELTEDDMFKASVPLFDISNDAAQKLFDQLYDLGFRQTDVGTAGHLKATEKHLEDMRKIAFDQLDRLNNSPMAIVIPGE